MSAQRPGQPAFAVSRLNAARRSVSYGHFGREEPRFTWEQTDLATALGEAAESPGRCDIAP